MPHTVTAQPELMMTDSIVNLVPINVLNVPKVHPTVLYVLKKELILLQNAHVQMDNMSSIKLVKIVTINVKNVPELPKIVPFVAKTEWKAQSVTVHLVIIMLITTHNVQNVATDVKLVSEIYTTVMNVLQIP